MTFSELTQAILRHDDSSFIEFVQENQNDIKLLFLNAEIELDTQALVTDGFLALHQKNFSDTVRIEDEFQGLINHFALYFKKANRIPLVASCKHLSILPTFRNRIEAFIFTRQYNDVYQHIIRFTEYLNLLAQASDSEDTDFTSEIVDDIAEYYTFGKEQLTAFGQESKVSEFEALFENEDLLEEYPVLYTVLIKLFNRVFDLPVNNITDKIYEPSTFTAKFFDYKFVNPVRVHPKTVWHRILLGFPKDEIRYDIIELGQADFDKEYGHVLTGKEIVLLYCYFNMRKHYFTSLSIFERLGNLIEIYKTRKRIKFIDIGCGPATSGIALIDFIHNHTNKAVLIDYFGVDIAKSMRETAEDFIKNEVLDINSLVRIVGDVTELNLDEISEGACIIFNTCYLFASPRLDIKKLANFVNKVRINNKKVLTYLLFQNPDDKGKNENYFLFKKLLDPFETTYSEVDTVFYNNKPNSPFEAVSEHVFYELLKL